MNTQETFISHLVELRTRLIRALLAVVVIFVCLFPWAKDLYSLLANPLLASLPQGGQMIATDVVGVFVVPMKVAFLVAFLIALPYVLYQMWAFVAPGLYAHEKRLVLPLVIASSVLFFIGMSFAYFLVFPVVFKFMASIAPEGVAWMTDIEKYLAFARHRHPSRRDLPAPAGGSAVPSLRTGHLPLALCRRRAKIGRGSAG